EEAKAEAVWTRWLRIVQGALQLSPGLPEARARLAEFHHGRARRAHDRGQRLDEVRHRGLLAQYDGGRFAGFLNRRSVLSLYTDPAEVEVTLYRYEMVNRRLEPRKVKELGRTPLVEEEVPAGSLLLELTLPNGERRRIPAFVEGGEAWVTVRPGDDEPWVHVLPDLDPDECWMPAGWFLSGGDLLALDGIDRRRLFVGDRILEQHVVTNRRYIDFLNHLWRNGRESEAWEHAPGIPAAEHPAQYAVRLGPNGFELDGLQNGALWEPDWPVCMVPFTGAEAFAAWWAEQTRKPWRIPHDQEVEKAGRGVDGRMLAWGEHFEPAWARVFYSDRASPSRASIHDYPLDCSVYDVRGLSGNVRVWCSNGYSFDGPPDGSEIEPPTGEQGEFRMIRGTWYLVASQPGRLASRFAGLPHGRYNSAGIRLIRP
ncbi:MAG: SUMF1/EgtB/PvdO family nonheme iron enzyme, partial [Myxococcota bacterium]